MVLWASGVGWFCSPVVLRGRVVLRSASGAGLGGSAVGFHSGGWFSSRLVRLASVLRFSGCALLVLGLVLRKCSIDGLSVH